MNRRFLLSVFKKTFLFVLLTALFGSVESFAQSSGYGDFIIFEDFGRAVPGNPDHEHYTSTQNGNQGQVYFRKTPLSDIDPNNLLFYIPSNPPASYGSTNWGPQYRDNVGRGSYSIVTNSRGYRNVYFYAGLDHTEGDGELGYMLLVDAHSSTTLYFDREMEGLCAGTRFEFSAWVKDVNNGGSTKPRIQFDIINASTNALISSYPSTDDDVSPANTWKQITMDFEMPAGVNKIKLRISNIVSQHNGNDIAIDDIGFRPMGPSLNFGASPESPVCIGETVTFTANVVNAGEAYPTNHFVLQGRENGSAAWSNVGNYETSYGADQVTFTLSNVTMAHDNYEYRVVVAGDPTTLDNENCRTVSSPILLRVRNHLPEISVVGGNAEICANEAVQLNATVTGGIGSPVYTYVWERSVDQNLWEVIAGETAATLDSGPLSQATYYRVTAYVDGVDGCAGAGASDVFEVKVNALPVAPVAVDQVTYVGATGIEYNVTASADYTLIWFDENGNPLTPNEKPAVSTAVAGEFTAYAAHQDNETGCVSEIVPVKVVVKRVELSVEKTVDLTDINGTGQLAYTIIIENTGEFDLTNVGITDVLKQQGVADETLAVGVAVESNNADNILEIGETWTYAFVYTVDQLRIDKGADLQNTVSVTTGEGATDEDEITTTITQSPSVSVDKVVDLASIAAPSTLNYTITVANTGNVSLTGIAVTDAVTQDGTSAALALGAPSGDDTNPGILDVGETWVYTVSYAAEQSHIDNGSDIVNVFTFDADELTGEVSDDATTAITQSASVSVDKVVDLASIAAPSTLNYTITVANTGNVSLTGIAVTDAVTQDGTSAALALGAPSGDDTNPGILDVGETWVYTVSYAAEQSHIDNGSDIVNVFTFDADELGTPESDDATTAITQSASVSVGKVVDETNIAVPSTLNYTIIVENTGNVSLTGVAVTDAVSQDGTSAALALGAPSGDDTNPGILDVGETWTYTVSYAAEQLHIDNGSDIVNTFTFGADELTSDVSDDATTTITQSPSVSVEKVVDATNIATPSTL
ncbi:hypothetical protein, partial [Parapedobacter sp. 2B3]|uniref:DUF7507 domain-containing protein n=1 Tax=Parapedobacter sp. 2B3 TaxID=3342381 RepID=UPI0035B642D8